MPGETIFSQGKAEEYLCGEIGLTAISVHKSDDNAALREKRPPNSFIRRYTMGKLEGKKLLLLGERDGVPSPAMEAVFKNSGAEMIFSATECFV